MTFRAEEDNQLANAEMENYFVNPKIFNPEQRQVSLMRLREITSFLGPVVSGYPSWHPLVEGRDFMYFPFTVPRVDCGYEGLDHTIFFVNGFITCPYGSPDKVLESVKRREEEGDFFIAAQVLDFPLYSMNAFPILVTCDLGVDLENDGTIPLPLAISLLLKKELPCSENSTVAETWKTMKPYFLGTPHGAISSHFVNMRNGRAMKKLWDCLIKTGIYGPIHG